MLRPLAFVGGLLLCGLVYGTVPQVTADQQSQTNDSLALVHATVIDGTGTAPKLDQTVLVTAQRITAVSNSASLTLPRGIRIVDASGRFLIPGLWDMHVHTRYDGIDHLGLLLANGITSARDMAGPWSHLETMRRWRTEIERGDRVGPRLVFAGPLLDGPGSPWSHAVIVAGPGEGREMVRRLRQEAADFVKVYSRLSRDSFIAIADEAKRQGLAFVGHVPNAINAGEASDAGQRSIEHLEDLLLASAEREGELRKELVDRSRPVPQILVDASRSFSRPKATALFARLKRNQTSVVPTLSLFWTTRALAAGEVTTQQADIRRFIPPAYLKEWSAAPRGSQQVQESLFARYTELVRELHAAGVELLAGTDVVKPMFVPGSTLHLELSLLVKAGLTEMEAIEAATRKPARFVGLKNVGTIEPGMLADLVLLDADPLRNIENTRRIGAVVFRGRLLDRASIQTRFSDIERAAAQWNGTPTGR